MGRDGFEWVDGKKSNNLLFGFMLGRKFVYSLLNLLCVVPPFEFLFQLVHFLVAIFENLHECWYVRVQSGCP